MYLEVVFTLYACKPTPVNEASAILSVSVVVTLLLIVVRNHSLSDVPLSLVRYIFLAVTRGSLETGMPVKFTVVLPAVVITVKVLPALVSPSAVTYTAK